LSVRTVPGQRMAKAAAVKGWRQFAAAGAAERKGCVFIRSFYFTASLVYTLYTDMFYGARFVP